MRLLPAVIILAILVFAGCGEDTKTAAKQAPRAAEVIRDWADTLRKGDVSGASRFFALPATVANGAPEQELKTFADVKRFNASLPCGAELIRTREHFGVVIADFRLTERPGGDCGGGTGETASTAFEIRDGKIVRWLRVPEDAEPQPEGELI